MNTIQNIPRSNFEGAGSQPYLFQSLPLKNDSGEKAFNFNRARHQLAMNAYIIMNQGLDLQQWFETQVHQTPPRTS